MMSGTITHRIIGGSPFGVLVRLLLLSLLVGALMSWLDIDPAALFDWLQATVMQLWREGFRSLHQIGRYLVTGAAVVVPIWLLMRLVSIGSRSPTPPSGPGRWNLPGAPSGEGFSSRARTEPRD